MQIVTDEFQKEMKEHGNFSFPFLVSMERLSKYETGSFLWHWHPAIELTLVTKGQMIYKVNDSTFHLKEGEALFGNTNTLHSGQMLKNQDCEYTSITFEPRLVYGNENSIVYIKYVKPVLQNFSLSALHFDLSQEWHEKILQIIKDMIKTESEKNPAYEIDIIVKLNEFWQQIYLYHQSRSQDLPGDKCNYDRIRIILSYIEKNYAAKLTLEDISGQIHLCESECSRLFKKYMKISLFEFILQYRIEKSIDYLLNTNYSVSLIAESVGFSDSNYFSKVFRRLKGCSPTKYRHKSS